MMKRKPFFAIGLALMLFSVTGCQLALEDAGMNGGGDRLVGVFVTKGYLDRLDMGAYLNDNNLIDLSEDGDIALEVDSKNYQDRLQATLTTRSWIDETGMSNEEREFIFENIDGINFFAATIPATENEESYLSSKFDEAISDAYIDIHIADDADRIELEGTMVISPGFLSDALYINPVYQSEDGSVYVTSGSGFATGGMQDEGSIFSQTLEETKTVTGNAPSKKASILIKISIEVMFPAEKVVLMEMAADSTVMKRTEYVPGELPDHLVPEAETQYIIFETHKQNREGDIKISRSIHDKNDEGLENFLCRKDGVFVKEWVGIDWSDH